MKTLNEFINEHISSSYNYEENPYPLLYIDLLSKCNMKCHICYNSNMPETYLTLSDYGLLLKKLNNKVFMRFVGGEPTIHEDFFKFIQLAREHKHFVTISSNGLMYADDNFIKELKQPIYNNRLCGYGITLNGGFNLKHQAWKIIDACDENIIKLKFKGLDNLINNKIINIGLTAIIVRELNEDIVKAITQYSINNNIKNVKFRSVGTNLTDFKTESYTTYEFMNEVFPFQPEKYICSGLKKDDNRCNECCCEFKINNTTIKHIEFGTEGANKCWKRGYVDFAQGLIYPFFEYEVLKEKYYETKNIRT